MPTVATVDVFSGRPNPSVELTAEFAKIWQKSLQRVQPEVFNTNPQLPDLGYRGVLVHGSDDPLAEKGWRVFGGRLYSRDLTLAYPGRALERWLLHLILNSQPSLLSAIEKQF